MTAYLSIRETARTLGRSTRAVYALIRAGKLPEPVPATVMTNGGRTPVRGLPRDVVLALVDSTPAPIVEARAEAAQVSFDYHTHRGDVRLVWVTESTMQFLTDPTEQYPDRAPKLRAWDVDREDWRTYRLSKVVRWHDGP